MTKEQDTTFIQIIHPVCCGLDVHKDKISACLLTVGKNGEEIHELREFNTFTESLYEMKKWLIANNCPVVAMESTGVYWRPIHNVLEDSMKVILVNARHIKNVPGRKTDLSDSKWLAGLLRHGLLKGSFMETISTLEAQIKAINQRVDKLTQEQEDLLDRLDAIPGIDKKSAQAIIGEIGITLEEFACVAAFVSWAGLCPGNNESAGKRKSGRSPVRSHPLKTLLIQVAWAAIKTKGSYYKAKYYKLKVKRGAKKAIVAIAHRIAKAIYNIVKNGDTYRDIGEDFLTGSERERAIYNLKKKADALGYNVVPCTA
ncbi:MAG: transposase [Desulfamplus sp.]|nr:transposase [Desulfamplus sp.]